MQSNRDVIIHESKPVPDRAGIQVRLDVRPADLERLRHQADKRGLSMAAYARMVVLARIGEDEQADEIETIKGGKASAPSASPKIASLRLRDETLRRMSRGLGKNFNDVANEVARLLEPYKSRDAGGKTRYLLDVEATTLLAKLKSVAKQMDEALELGDVELAELWTRRATAGGLKLIEHLKAGTSARR